MGGLFKSRKLKLLLNPVWRAIRAARDRAIEELITKLVERKIGQANPAVRQLLDEQIDTLREKLSK